ncbi:MAG: PqqD family protein [Gammaproteobacteria bacterium]|nr:PqqD family protein [Gammaproteobacteria bacterium]
MTADTQYQLIDNISLTEVDNEMVLLNLSTGTYFGLNHVGAHLVRNLEKRVPIDQTVHEIAENYRMDYSIVNQDIERLLGQLLKQSLITEDR